MKRRLLRHLLPFALLLVLLTGTASADTGPKPSVRIRVTGLEGQTCYATLLSEQVSTGPYSAFDAFPELEERSFEEDGRYYGEDDVPAGLEARWEAFQSYAETDDYHFLQCWWTVTEEDDLAWTYYPPQSFKLLLWFPDTGEYRISGVTERYAFDSYYVADAGVDGLLELDQSYDLRWELISLVCRILLTLALELALAWAFRYRSKRQVRLIAFVNCVTQIGLNVAVNVVNYISGQFAYLFWFVVLELAVFAVEALIYRRWLPRTEGAAHHPVVYALCANLLSAVLGIWLSFLIPGIF